MFILFDANVWVSQLGLRSKNGSAVRFYARQRNAIIAIPEVVQLEVEEVLVSTLRKKRDQIKEGYRYLLPIFGELQSIAVPSEANIREKVAGIIPDFDIPTRQIPFELEAARDSLMKLLRKTPPSKRAEQFRDGVIWANCLGLLKEGEVYFVTHDSAFYEQRKYENGMAQALIDEMREKSSVHEVRLFSNLESLLEEIRVPIHMDKIQIFESIVTEENEGIGELLHSNGFELYGRVGGKVNYFATENAHEIYFRFELAHPTNDKTGERRRDATLLLEGFGFLNSETMQVSEVKLTRVSLDYPDWQPGGPAKGMVFVSAHINAPQVHEIKIPIQVEDPPVFSEQQAEV